MLERISNFLDLPRLDLWPRMWAILKNVSSSLEKKVKFIVLGWTISQYLLLHREFSCILLMIKEVYFLWTHFFSWYNPTQLNKFITSKWSDFSGLPNGATWKLALAASSFYILIKCLIQVFYLKYFLQFSHSAVSDSLWPHRLQHVDLPVHHS